jgi:flagellar protein FlaG
MKEVVLMDIQLVSSQAASQFANMQSDIKATPPPVAAPAVAAPSAPPAQPVAPASTASEVVTAEEVAKAVGQINQVIQHFNPDIEFTVDPSTKIDVVRVIDKVSGQVIRQFPSDAVLGIAQALDKLQGLLVRQRI